MKFEFFGQDAATGSYLMVIRDADGNFVYSALGELASSDISVTYP